MGVFGQQGGVSSRYVRYLASYAVPEDHICPCLPGTKLARGFILARLPDSIEMNAEYQVGTSLARISGSNHVLIALLLRRHSELRSVVIWVPDFVFEIQEWRGLYSLGALVRASQSVPSDFDLVACGGSSRMSSRPTGTPSPRVPDFVCRIREWQGLLSMAALLHVSQSVPRAVSIFGCRQDVEVGC